MVGGIEGDDENLIGFAGAGDRDREDAEMGRDVGALTWMVVVPLIEAVAVSVADTVWAPTVLRVMVNLPTPPVRVAVAGSTAALSPLEKWMEPA